MSDFLLIIGRRGCYCWCNFQLLLVQDVKRFKVDNPKNFHYLNQSSCYNVDAIDDAKEYLAARRAMDVVGIGSDEQVA